MTEQEKKVIAECLTDSIRCATDTVYESLSIMFETMAKHPEYTLQEVLTAMSIGLKMLISKKENKDEQRNINQKL